MVKLVRVLWLLFLFLMTETYVFMMFAFTKELDREFGFTYIIITVICLILSIATLVIRGVLKKKLRLEKERLENLIKSIGKN